MGRVNHICLASELLTIFIISAVDTVFIIDKALHGRSSMIGGDGPGGRVDCIAARITSNLFFEVDRLNSEVIGSVRR